MVVQESGAAVEEELRARLDHYPAVSYPMQHATAQFHLGVLMTNAGRLEEAARALETASSLFNPQKLPEEHAKSQNALGAVFRLQGRPAEAAHTFEQAAALFEQSGAALERGAAVFNLGLVHRDLGDFEAAIRSFEGARALLDSAKVPSQAAGAARELGITLLQAGDGDGAIGYLVEGMELAERGGDRAGLGATANALGLAHLALGHLQQAVEALQTAVATNPRTIRPDAYAMAKANLALAYEQADDAPRARLAARQGLQLGAPAGPVRDQAAEILGRLGNPSGDLLAALDAEQAARWPAMVREELIRWIDAPSEESQAETEAWIEGVAARREAAADLAEAWLGALLELTPEEMERAITATLQALAGREQDIQTRFRSSVSRAMPRFHSPQFVRLKDAFARIASLIRAEGWS